MANINLSAKSGINWTNLELTAFNIQVQFVDAANFFNMAQLPDPPVSQVILTNKSRPGGPLADQDRLFFGYMQDAERGGQSEASDFAAFLLRMFEYDNAELVIRRRKETTFVMCGVPVTERPDICLMSGFEYRLLVKGDEYESVRSGRTDPEQELIAWAIAAFYQNNYRRKMAARPEVKSQTFFGITMVGVAATFYKIPVTEELAECVEGGRYSPEKTIVQKCCPPVPDLFIYSQDGLLPLADRYVIMQCFEAFKAFL